MKTLHKLFIAIMKIMLMPSLAALVVLASCSLPVLGLPKAAASTTPRGNASISTVAAAQTEAVQSVYQTLTQGAALTPSATPPALTDTVQPTSKSKTQLAPTATKKFAATKKPSPTVNPYHCFITTVSPLSGSSITKGKNFDFKVTFRNDGSETWTPSTVDFTYLSGPKFQKSSSTIKLSKDILPGQSVKLQVDMTANSARGTQAINWALEQGNGIYFCYVGITLTVK
jgi:hypothetical protein